MSEPDAAKADGATGLAVQQTEFPMRVAICAWCKPKERGGALGAISHGICPRHLNKVRLSLLKPRRRKTKTPEGSCADKTQKSLDKSPRQQGLAL